jgi:4a-hydroxytetrahydrobiopterin dehydratase
MTETLADKKSTPCRGGVLRVALAEAERFRSQTPNWDLRDNSHRIERTFRFTNFREALSFVRDVGDSAETEGHHPDVSFGWTWRRQPGSKRMIIEIFPSRLYAFESP